MRKIVLSLLAIWFVHNLLTLPVANRAEQICRYVIVGYVVAWVAFANLSWKNARKWRFVGIAVLCLLYGTQLVVNGTSLALLVAFASASFGLLGAILHSKWVSTGEFIRRRLDPRESHGGLLLFIAPRSHPAALYSVACLGFAACWPLEPTFNQAQLIHQLIVLSITTFPLILLAVALWYHLSAVRVIGPVVCAIGSVIFWLGDLWGFVLTAIIIGWNFAYWSWENPRWLRRFDFMK